MEIRDLEPDDLDRALDLQVRSFGPVPEAERANWTQRMRDAVAEQRVLAGYDGVRLAATARINRYRQWWHGRSLPMAGVAGVLVAPEDRGRGLAGSLMRAVLRRAQSQGFPLSALYPATVPLYRSLGWETAGSRYTVTVPADALRPLSDGPAPLRRVGPDDAAEILSVVRAVHTASRSSGPIDWDEAEVAKWLAEDEPFGYLAADGFLAYHWDGEDFRVDEVVAGSAATARALWSLVGSGSSIATSVTACIGPHDPVRWLTREAVVRPVREQRWMLRLLDVPAALAGRGYPAAADAEVAIAVEDAETPGNSGTWQINVSKGEARVARTGAHADAVRLGPRGMAALYAGTPLSTLRTAGLAFGGGGTDALLDTVFAGTPYLLDYF